MGGESSQACKDTVCVAAGAAQIDQESASSKAKVHHACLIMFSWLFRSCKNMISRNVRCGCRGGRMA